MANDFLPFGTSESANVLPQAEYAALASRSTGFVAGTAVSKQLNKAWRQSSVMSHVLAEFIAVNSGEDVLDDGDVATIQNNLTLAIQAAIADGIPYATEAEAEAGTSTTKSMNPLRVFQAIAAVVKQATETAFGWLKIATLSQTNTGTDDATAVTPKKLAAAIQTQTLNAGTTAGTGTAYTLSSIPGLASYVTKLRLNVTFHADSGSNPTINVNAISNKNLKQYDPDGAKVAAKVITGQNSDILYDGTDFIVLNQLPSFANAIGIQGSFKNLVGSANGTGPAVSYSVDEIVVESSTNRYQTLRSVNLSLLSFANTGANGLDTGAGGSQAPSSWYSVWVIWNGTTVAGLLSLSATAPAMPPGYTHKARVGWVRTDSTGSRNPLAFTQAGRQVDYAPNAGTNTPVWPVMASGIAGTFNGSVYTPAAVAVSNFVPPTASKIRGRGNMSTNVLASVMMSGEAGTYTGSPGANPPQFGGYGYNQTSVWTVYFDILLKSANMYWVSSDAGGYLRVFGWEDNI